jgi:hypothetical protein
MVRNIPNKYSQDMLLELFEKNHKKKFDFFYLPIDYNVFMLRLRTTAMLVMLSSILSIRNSSRSFTKNSTTTNGTNLIRLKFAKSVMQGYKERPSLNTILNTLMSSIKKINAIDLSLVLSLWLITFIHLFANRGKDREKDKQLNMIEFSIYAQNRVQLGYNNY